MYPIVQGVAIFNTKSWSLTNYTMIFITLTYIIVTYEYNGHVHIEIGSVGLA